MIHFLILGLLEAVLINNFQPNLTLVRAHARAFFLFLYFLDYLTHKFSDLQNKIKVYYLYLTLLILYLKYLLAQLRSSRSVNDTIARR